MVEMKICFLIISRECGRLFTLIILLQPHALALEIVASRPSFLIYAMSVV